MERTISGPSREISGLVGRVLRGLHPASLMLLVAAALGLLFLADVDVEDPAWASTLREAGLQRQAPSRVLAGGTVQDLVEASSSTPAKPFHFSALDQVSKERAEKCLAEAIYYEAGSESEDGQRAVAQVVLNRVRHASFPSSICGVVYQGSTRQTGCQFTFTCDGSLARRPSPSGWQQALAVARRALDGAVYAPVGFATHYHAVWTLPYWASSVAMIGKVGGHVFYSWEGPAGSAAAFTQAYAGLEASVMRTAEVDQSSPIDDSMVALVPRDLRSTTGAGDPLADPDNADLLNFRRASNDRRSVRSDEVAVASSIEAALE